MQSDAKTVDTDTLREKILRCGISHKLTDSLYVVSKVGISGGLSKTKVEFVTRGTLQWPFEEAERESENGDAADTCDSFYW